MFPWFVLVSELLRCANWTRHGIAFSRILKQFSCSVVCRNKILSLILIRIGLRYDVTYLANYRLRWSNWPWNIIGVELFHVNEPTELDRISSKTFIFIITHDLYCWPLSPSEGCLDICKLVFLLWSCFFFYHISHKIQLKRTFTCEMFFSLCPLLFINIALS